MIEPNARAVAAIDAYLATHTVTPETPDETTARMKADMDRRLTDPVVRASVCRLPKGYTLVKRPTIPAGALKAAREGSPTAASIRALPLTDPTEPPEAA